MVANGPRRPLCYHSRAMKSAVLLAVFALSFLPALAPAAPPPTAPAWAKEVVWYQIFPERFRNGDPRNDPPREYLEFPVEPGKGWRVTRWTQDWYARDDWEKELGADFYQNGVFHRRYGGDLQGVLDKLPYLADLGVNALYFNPLFAARSLHKYDGNSYHHIDPYFGPDPKGDLALMATETADPKTWKWTAADRLFLEVVRRAKELKMRVILDGVWNHTGRDFFAFKDVREKQEKSPYKDWYKVTSWDDPDTTRNEFDYEGWWGHKTLPVFAASKDGSDMHPGPKAYIWESTRRWMKPVVDGKELPGVDGWRLDVAEERSTKFWAQWNDFVRELNPEAYTVAEIWKDAVRFIADGHFSASMNYYSFAIPVRGWLVDNHPSVPPSRFVKLLEDRRASFPRDTQYVLQNLLDSHDTERLATMVVNAALSKYEPPDIPFNVGNNTPRDNNRYDVQRPNAHAWRITRMCLLLQMAYLGAPMIYYGTEAGMWGGHDPDNRQPMVWADLKYDAFQADPLGRPHGKDEVKFDSEMFTWVKSAVALRQKHSCLRLGECRTLGGWDAQNSAALLRRDDQGAFVIALNRSEQPQTLTIPLPAADAARFAAPKILLLSSGAATEATVARAGDALKITLPPLCAAVVGD